MAINKGLIRFHVVEAFSFPAKKELKLAVLDLMTEEGKSFASLDYIFCSDKFLLGINQSYLQHDDLTDIITFNLSEAKGEIIGEIYISVERVRDNALLFNASFSEELRRVVFHGALHLCGYGDKTQNDQKVMRARENYYLEKIS